MDEVLANREEYDARTDAPGRAPTTGSKTSARK
jgi:hypothetical protein